MVHSPARCLVLDEFNHAGGIKRAHGTAAAFPRHDLIAQRASSRSAGQVNERPLWMVEGIRVGRNLSPAHTQEVCNPVAISKEPSFNGADDDPEAHVCRGIGQPPSGARWCAFAIAVEIDEDDPGGTLCCSVVAANTSEQSCLSLSAVDIGEHQANPPDELDEALPRRDRPPRRRIRSARVSPRIAQAAPVLGDGSRAEGLRAAARRRRPAPLPGRDRSPPGRECPLRAV